MTISYDHRQRVLAMLDHRPPEDPDATDPELDAAMRSLFRDIAAVVPDAQVDDVKDIVEEYEERLRDRAERATRKADLMQFVQTVAQRDPELVGDEPIFDAIRRLAGRGDEDAQRVLAEFESPLRRAVGHITTAALDGADDWIRSGDAHRRTKGGRS